jgi:hypothetical protein
MKLQDNTPRKPFTGLESAEASPFTEGRMSIWSIQEPERFEAEESCVS